MMESSHEITKLCESWWGKLTDTTKEDQHRFAEQLLSLLGWRSVTATEPKPVLAHLSAISYLLRAGSQAIGVYFVMPGTLEPPTSLVNRGLDFCEATRLLVNEALASNTDYAFVTDLYRSYLYDARTDELLLYADSPAEFRRELAQVLRKDDIEQGALEAIRRQPRSHTARMLREWCHRWCERIVSEAHASEEAGFLALDRLLALRYLFEHDILKRTGWRLRKRFSDLVGKAFSRDPGGCGRQLVVLFHDIWFDWKADLFSGAPAVDAVLARDDIAAALLKEFALHSRTKFTIASILESFNYGDAAEKQRVRMVPDANEDRERILSQLTVENVDSGQIQIDLADEGYRSIFHWFDELVATYDRLDIEFEAQENRGFQPVEEIDLLAWSEIAAKRPKALTDKLQYAAEHGIVVYHASPRQFRTARLMLHLHLIGRYYQTKQRFTHFPDMSQTLQERPRVLDTDRKWIYQPPAKDDDIWDDVIERR